MKAFNNDLETKKLYVNRMHSHFKADEIIQGTGWENGKGCFIGCSFHNYDHGNFEDIGLPIWLAKLSDRIFEGLNNKDAKIFARDFYTKINPGSNLNNIKIPFMIEVCESVLDCVKEERYTLQRKVIENVLKELKKYEIDKEKIKNAAAYADAAYADAAYAAAYAVVYAAYAAVYADTADAAAKNKKYKYFADKLFELMESET